MRKIWIVLFVTVLTTVVIGIFYILVSYSEVIGFGVSKAGLAKLQSDQVPFNEDIVQSNLPAARAPFIPIGTILWVASSTHEDRFFDAFHTTWLIRTLPLTANSELGLLAETTRVEPARAVMSAMLVPEPKALEPTSRTAAPLVAIK